MMFYYIWNGLVLIIGIGLPVVLVIASNGMYPISIHLQEINARRGTPKKKPTDR